MDNVCRMEKTTKRRDEEIKKEAQHTEDKSSMTRTSSDLAGLLISVGKIVLREESGQYKDFEEGNRCSSHASATATCKQNRPRRKGKTKQATHGSKSSLWLIRLGRS